MELICDIGINSYVWNQCTCRNKIPFCIYKEKSLAISFIHNIKSVFHYTVYGRVHGRCRNRCEKGILQMWLCQRGPSKRHVIDACPSPSKSHATQLGPPLSPPKWAAIVAILAGWHGDAHTTPLDILSVCWILLMVERLSGVFKRRR